MQSQISEPHTPSSSSWIVPPPPPAPSVLSKTIQVSHNGRVYVRVLARDWRTDRQQDSHWLACPHKGQKRGTGEIRGIYFDRGYERWGEGLKKKYPPELIMLKSKGPMTKNDIPRYLPPPPSINKSVYAPGGYHRLWTRFTSYTDNFCDNKDYCLQQKLISKKQKA